MALAISLLWSGYSTTSSTTIASGTITPSANALLIAAAFCNATASAPNVTGVADDLDDVGAWSERAEVAYGSNPFSSVSLWTAQCGAVPGDGVVTVTWGASYARKVLHVYEVTGHDVDAPVTQVKTNTSSATTLTVTLDGAPAADSMVFAGMAIANADNPSSNIAPGAGFTEGGEVDCATGTDGLDTETMYDIASADTTADWSNIKDAQHNVGGAMEIKAAAAGVIAQLSSVAWASIGQIAGVANASIAQIAGVVAN